MAGSSPERVLDFLAYDSIGMDVYTRYYKWGTGEALTADGGSGGGVDPLFVWNMASFLKANRSVYSDYRDCHAIGDDASVSDGSARPSE